LLRIRSSGHAPEKGCTGEDLPDHSRTSTGGRRDQRDGAGILAPRIAHHVRITFVGGDIDAFVDDDDALRAAPS
jgi:hypothetical protein